MQNNANTATPVNVEGFAPGVGVDVTIVAPLPLPVQLIAPLPVPVTLPTPTYSVKHQDSNAGILLVSKILSAVPCEIDIVAGYNSDPTSSNLLYVQLHNKATAVNPGDVPYIVVPVYGGKSPYSIGAELVFSVGLVLALSTTENTYTAASAFLSFFSIWRTAV